MKSGLVVFFLSCVMTFLFRKVCTDSSWLDIPNQRSSHTVPVPKGAGILFAVLLAGAAIVNGWLGNLAVAEVSPVLAGVVLAVLGLVDDFRNLSIHTRLLVQALMVGLLIAVSGDALTFDLPWGMQLAGYPLMALCFVGFIWFINLFNFMDGMDGLAASEAVFVCSVFLLLSGVPVGSGSGLLALLLISILAGFAIFNFPPASVFMGDAGSNFLAFMILVLICLSQLESSLSPWTWMVALGLFVVDSGYTLFRRILTGQVWYHAHNTHGYQKLLSAYGHARTLVLLSVINLLWLLPWCWMSERYQALGSLFVLIAYLPLVVALPLLGAGERTE